MTGFWEEALDEPGGLAWRTSTNDEADQGFDIEECFGYLDRTDPAVREAQGALQDIVRQRDVYRTVLLGLLESCRSCRMQEPPVVTPAEFVVWGQYAEITGHTGPLCYDHAVEAHGAHMPYRADQYAVVDLRPVRQALGR